MEADRGLAQALPAPRVGQRASRPSGFVEFFRKHYGDLVKTAMYAGATRDQADDATAAVMKEVLQRWRDLDAPLAYARRAVVTNFIKEKTRSLDRVRLRMVERAAEAPEGRDDPGLTVWEDSQWVIYLLETLPLGQREVLAFIVDGFTPTEIAALLGRSRTAVRQSLHSARQRLKQALQHDHGDEQRSGRANHSSRKEAR